MGGDLRVTPHHTPAVPGSPVGVPAVCVGAPASQSSVNRWVLSLT